MIRTPNDICLLCKVKLSTRTNSHIVPAPLLENVHGGRNKEHSFVFSSDSTKITEYYGNQNPQQLSTEVRHPNFSYDYILCEDCENYFGRLEAICNNVLKRICIETNKDRVIIKNFAGVDYFEIQNINGATIRLLFYSIIWRIIISDYLENDSFVKTIIKLENKIRDILLQFSNLKEKELSKIQFNDNFKIKVATSLQDKFSISQFFNSYSQNPYFFIAGRFIIILFNLGEEMNSTSRELVVGFNPILNQAKEKFKVLIFPNEKYDKIIDSNYKVFLEHLSPEKIAVLKFELGKIVNGFNNDVS